MDSKQQEKRIIQSCWTCKDRKVRCDGYLPTCINCTRAKRKCVRLITRLSWPKKKGGHRFLTSDQLPPSFKMPEIYRNRRLVFLNTSEWDITLQKELERNGISPTHFNAWPSELPRQLSHIPRTGPEGQALISYFDSTMSHILAPFGDISRISHSLLRIALTDETSSSSAVLQGILALSSLKLYGNAEALPFKCRAISMLSDALKKNMDRNEYLRCLAASLLLSSYEIFSTADLSTNWTFFVCGSIKIVKAMSLPRILDDEALLLLDWFSSHTILAQFSQSHWVQHESCVYQQPCAEDPRLSIVYSLIPERSRILSFLGCSLEFLDILSSICSAVLPRTNPNFLSNAHSRHLDSLELHLEFLRQQSEALVFKSEEERKTTESVAELYRLAGQIYLHRAARKTRENFPPTEKLIKEAFSIVQWLGCCEGLWPLFIVGCEARSDEHRLKILEIFTKTLQTRDAGNIRSIKKMIESCWIQDDLREEEETDYVSRINAMMSAHHVLPTFI